ncbi:hypothetical protein L2737_08790 [Shewanella electrodiphila]|uniref:Lipoprotein n=1 Tax=Shewanella electrodiphila TaxID=934143 RepID=A0ABT0KNJ5_9GAMM|nr:hypothetical protein [Shewanella electrodiphila]MCL1045421.1 hypothetical protein [Shewanella electrodiphila]
MKKVLLCAVITMAITGCSTPKIRVPVDANKITYYNPVVSTLMNCMPVTSFTVPEQHPNNFESYIKVELFKQGATHYSVHVTDETMKGLPISGEVDAYFCQKKEEDKPVQQPQQTQQVQPQLPVYIINNNNNNNN